MVSPRAFATTTFRSLRVRNYKLFFFGQGTRVEQQFKPLKVLRLGWFRMERGPPEEFHLLIVEVVLGNRSRIESDFSFKSFSITFPRGWPTGNPRSPEFQKSLTPITFFVQ